MKCPKCSIGTAWVVGGREKNGGVRRRRVCKKCGYRFTTTEIQIDQAKQLMENAARIIRDIKKM